MPQDWRDPAVARAWDARGDKSNPTRAEQLDILVSLLADVMSPGDWMLDLGYGSGKVEDLIFQRIPHIRVVGIDNSAAMAELAATRLRPYADRFVPVHGNLAALPTIELPVSEFRAVIAVQSLHHLSAPDMQNAYRRIHALLQPGGVFLLLDRIHVESAAVFPLLRSVWRRLDRQHGSDTAVHEGENYATHEANLREQGDRPVTLEMHLGWLRACGFDVATLHLHGNRALIAALK